MASSFPIVRLQREPEKGKRFKGRRAYVPAKLPYQRQAELLGERLAELTSTIDSFEKGIDVSSDPRAVVPERALVIELMAPVRDFELAAHALGFEWMTSLRVQAQVQDDGDEADEGDEGAAGQPQLLYLTMPSLQGLKRLLSNWKRFKSGESAPADSRALWNLFGYLLEIRTWSAKDRIDPGIARYVQRLLEQEPTKPVMVEVDLWYRNAGERRDKAVSTLEALLKDVGGTMLDFVEIEEIRYQGALVELPARVAADLLAGSGTLPNLDEIMTIRPQAAFEPHSSDTGPSMGATVSAEPAAKRCIAALLDGYPIEQHAALKDRLVLHEVDITGAAVPVGLRHHGTAMASLIIHGDLARGGAPLNRKLAIVPVIGTGAGGVAESTPPRKLPIGVIYRALKGMIAAGKADKPELSNVVVVNHSLCDTHAPFTNRPSPWAALLDYFSHVHRLLFVVSAGNIFEPFPSHDFADINALTATSPVEREAQILLALEKAKGTRGILSPAESINALTVGALHADGTTGCGPSDIDPFGSLVMTNLASAVGLGVNRSVKPDLVEEGGRFAAGTSNITGGGVNIHPKASPHMGNTVASPSPTGDLTRLARMSGTSNAAALTTRSCIQIADAVDETYLEDGDDWLARPTRAVILKALATHGCNWGSIGRVLEDSFPPADKHSWSRRRDGITRFLGYGRPSVDRIVSGTHNRITLLADGQIKGEELHEYRVPVPTSLLNTKEMRTITLTLAWTAPVVTTTSDYRGVALSLVDGEGKRKFWSGVEKPETPQPTAARSGQGTLIHLVLEGRKLRKSFDDLKGLFIGVQAMARHPSQLTVEVPYALAITLELAQTQTTQLYQQVRDAVRARARTRIAARR